MAETPFFLVYRRDPNLPLYQLLEPMQHFLGDPESGKINLKKHCLALAIARKTLDENHFRDAQKTTDRKPRTFQLGDVVWSLCLVLRTAPTALVDESNYISWYIYIGFLLLVAHVIWYLESMDVDMF